MARTTLGVIAGLAVWVTIVIAAGLIMRAAWADYARVADAMTFTVPMMVARLAIAALATLAMGLVTTLIARRSMRARLMPGVLSTRRVHPAARHALGQVSCLVSPHLSGVARSSRLPGREDRQPGQGTRALERAGLLTSAGVQE